ncbi:hypothetical protein [Bradyrhizobium sp. CCBAU 45394]|uniref:hypothetical protein n=1 Tax=Bradyrhizobium sp. CCBAU 45394 TaxID=1325087 RepID=UPI0023043644|nr:hypothetical protein [Bradyrhizobium sp. CCBAU 45394]
MKDKSLLGPWIRRFLLEHLVAERNPSRTTQASYRDTLTLLLPFASKQGGSAIDRMTVEELAPEVVLDRQAARSPATADDHPFTGALYRDAFAGSPGLVPRCGQCLSKRPPRPRSDTSKRPIWTRC